jgi:Fe-S cluster assembly scaffold IscU
MRSRLLPLANMASKRTPSLLSPSLFSPSSSLYQVSVRSYHERVVDHYENPRNVGSLDKDDPNVGTGLVGAPACGDVMKLMLKFDDEGKIIDAKFKTFGCGSAIASSSFATEHVKGMTKNEATALKNSEIAEHLKLPPVKIHCSMLAEDAIKAAVADFEKKQAAKKGT